MNLLIDYAMRGGAHPNERIDAFERQVMAHAWLAYSNHVHNMRKGLKWTYNYTHFHMSYGAQGDDLQMLFELRPYPQHIEIESTTICNLRCLMCENRYMPEQKKHLSYADFLKMMKSFPNLKQCGFTGIGNSYMNPDYMKMLDYMIKHDVAMEIFDTFNTIGEKEMQQWIDGTFYKIYCSLDAATKETYEKIRVGAKWENVISNLKKFDAMKKAQKAYYPRLCFHFIISKHNIHEVLDYIKFAHSLGIDIDFIQFTQVLHSYPEIEGQQVVVPMDIKEKSVQEGMKYGIKVTWNINTRESRPSINTCPVWIQPFIFCDGTVVPCCSMNEQNDREWQRQTSLGNVIKDDFRKIWNGKKYKVMLDAISQNKTCATCGRCILFEAGK